MTAYDSAEVESTDHPDDRDIRALAEYLTVLPEAPDLFQVVSQSGKSYTVDADAGVCECPDYEYREPDGGCKHIRRVAFATGVRPIPSGVNPATVDQLLGQHVKATHTELVATDGGHVVEREPTVEFTQHVEPPEQGGERYVRCGGCGAEILSKLGGRDAMIHREGCPISEGR